MVKVMVYVGVPWCVGMANLMKLSEGRNASIVKGVLFLGGSFVSFSAVPTIFGVGGYMAMITASHGDEAKRVGTRMLWVTGIGMVICMGVGVYCAKKGYSCGVMAWRYHKQLGGELSKQ